MQKASEQESPNRWPRSIGLIGLLAILIAIAFYFAKPGITAKDYGNVLTHRVSRGNLLVTVTEDGTLESSSNIEIKCNVKGGSTVLWVIETGTLVKPGDILVELDTSAIEDNVTQRKIAYETALANKIISESDVAVAKTSIIEYLEGTYEEEKSTLEKEIFDAEQAVRNAQLKLESSERLAAKGMVRSLQLEGEKFAVESARKELELKETKLYALEKFTREKMLQELRSALSAAEARLAADQSALELEVQRLEREKVQLENCTIRSTGEGLVIFPSAAAWKGSPDIEEGATVREQQTLLMIPDLNQMQVKVGIHESKVDRLTVGMPARVQLQDVVLNGKVSEIAEVTRPAGWWTGNLVEYDTIIKLEPRSGLKPGMSAIVEVILAEYEDVLTIPVAAIIESAEGFLCWVKTDQGMQKRVVELGDTNDEFTIVTAGLKEGDELVLNPLAYVDEAQLQSLRSGAKSTERRGAESNQDDAGNENGLTDVAAHNTSGDSPEAQKLTAIKKPKKSVKEVASGSGLSTSKEKITDTKRKPHATQSSDRAKASLNFAEVP